MDYSGGPNVIIGVLKSERRPGGVSQREVEQWKSSEMQRKKESLVIAPWKMGEGEHELRK